MEVFKVILSASLSVGTLFVIAKLMGHKQLSQLDFFDYISGITIGSIAAEMATNLESPWKALTALAVYGIASLLLNKITTKFSCSRKYINGTPDILMDQGKIYRDNLKKAKLDLSEFLMLCREQGYFDLNEIQTAVFEYNGKLSILPTSDSKPLCPQDIKLSTPNTEIGVEIIMDGLIMEENLSRIGLSAKWLDHELHLSGYEHAEQIFLAVYYRSQNKLDLYPR